MIKITNLHANVNDTPILKGLNLHIKPGEIHAIMGPNGSGKSTLSKVIAGHPAYEVTEGTVEFEGQNVLDMEPDERARLGMFMAFQYPVELPGVNNKGFMHMAINAKRKAQGQEDMPMDEFDAFLNDKLTFVNMDPEYMSRSVNEGFSGGEKKRNEILQMAVLDPKFAMLDETDSGLDIDALRIVADGVNKIMAPDKAMLVITHYQRLLDYIEPNVVHVLADGRIIKSGDKTLALTLEAEGYDRLLEEAGIVTDTADAKTMATV
jgi:Fe-S cluster assembly ATP-binding protein